MDYLSRALLTNFIFLLRVGENEIVIFAVLNETIGFYLSTKG